MGGSLIFYSAVEAFAGLLCPRLVLEGTGVVNDVGTDDRGVSRKEILKVESQCYKLSQYQTSSFSVVGEVVFTREISYINQCETRLQSFNIQKQWGIFIVDSCGNSPNKQQHMVQDRNSSSREIRKFL